MDIYKIFILLNVVVVIKMILKMILRNYFICNYSISILYKGKEKSVGWLECKF